MFLRKSNPRLKPRLIVFGMRIPRFLPVIVLVSNLFCQNGDWPVLCCLNVIWKLRSNCWPVFNWQKFDCWPRPQMHGALSMHRAIRNFQQQKHNQDLCSRLWSCGCLWVACILQSSENLCWTIQRRLLWLLGYWTYVYVQLTPKTQKFRRLTAISRQFQISPTFDWGWWDRSGVVYIRLHHQTGDFYIGSSSSNVFSREQLNTVS